jgi:two-component system, cell cycle sensor histidine kinase and response regulator CckA
MEVITPERSTGGVPPSTLELSGLLEAGPDAALDRLTRLAARVLRVPISLISLPAGDSMLFKSASGLPSSIAGMAVPLDATLCRVPLETGEPLVLQDASGDPRVRPGSPAAMLGARAYAAVPLCRSGGEKVGVFAVVDTEPRAWTDVEMEMLRDLSASVLTEIEWRIQSAERHHAAEQLRESEERYRLMIEGGTQVFFYTHDRDGRLTYVSPSVRAVIGYEPSDLIGRTYHALLTGDPTDAAVVANTAATLSSEGLPSSYHVTIRHRDGHKMMLEVVESATRRGGEVVGVQGFGRDISSKIRADEDLRIRTAYLEHLIENAPEAIVVLDVEEHVLRINREFTRTFGYAAEEAVGRSVSELIVPDADRESAERLSRAVAEGETLAARALRRTRDGRSIHVSILATPVVLDGAPTAIFGIYRDISDQVRAEEAVRRSEEYFRSLIEHSAEVIDILNPDGTIRYTTPSVRRVLGFEPDELIGRNVFDFVHPDDREAAVEAFERDQAAFDGSRTFELRVRHRDGSWRWFEAAARNLLENPAVGGIVITSRDVTARREAAAEMRRNTAVLAAIPDAVIVTDPAGTVTYWNQGAVRLFGWAESEVLGGKLHHHVPEDVRPRFESELRRALDGEEIKGEYEDIRRDGSRILTDTSISLIRDQKGRPAAVLRISRDITEQRLMGRVLEEMPEAVVFLNAENRIVSCNAAAERTFGYTAAEMIGRPVAMLSTEADERTAAPIVDVIAATRRNGGWSGEVVRRRKDGSHFPVRLITGVVRDSDGRIIGQAGLLRDLTEEKRNELQMRRAERMTSLGTLLGGLAHELNNPLTSIKSFAQLLLLDQRPAEDREGLEVIHQEADRAAQLVADLRLIARQTREMAGPSREPIGANEMVRSVVAQRQVALAASGLEIRMVLADGLAPVWGDRARLEQLLRQLVLNAEQAIFSGGRGGEIVVRTRAGGKGVVFEVSDTGPGISPADQERIFDPFWTTKAPGEGIGLGLSMAHTVVTEHEGEIRVESVPGRGATFTIELPPGEGMDLAREAAEATLRRYGPLRILLVEDEAPIRTSLARFLVRRGHHVDAVGTASEAIRRVESGEAYEVIVSDMRMPGMSGVELHARFAARGDGTETRMIFLTGDPSGCERNGSELHVGALILTKPFELNELAERIERFASSR